MSVIPPHDSPIYCYYYCGLLFTFIIEYIIEGRGTFQVVVSESNCAFKKSQCHGSFYTK